MNSGTYEEKLKKAPGVLELQEGASKEEIRKAYLRLALKWHPDKWMNSSEKERKDAEVKMKETNVAFGLLTGRISKEFISQQPNDDWVNDDLMGGIFGSHLSVEEVNLFIALAGGFIEYAKILLPRVKNLNIKARPGNAGIEDKAPLHYIVKNACEYPNEGWKECLEEVLSQNVNIATNSIVGAASVYTELININICDQIGTTPILIASQHGRTDLIEILLQHKADPNKLDAFSRNPLFRAASGNHIEAVKLLLLHKANISNGGCFSSDKAPYGIVNEEYNAEVTEILLDHASTEEKNKLLIESCKKGKIDLVKELLCTYTVDPNLELPGGYAIVLQEICQFDDKPNAVNIVGLLLKAGADPHLKVGSWPSALKIVQESANTELIELFAKHVKEDEKTKNDNQFNARLKQSSTPPFAGSIIPPKKIPQSSVSTQPIIPNNGNTKNNNHQFLGVSPRGWLIIAACAVVGAVALYLALGAAGAIAGGVVGSGVGYLTNLAVDQCFGEKQTQAA